MKIADITYTGPMRSQHRRGATGTEYRFRSPMGGEPTPVEVNSVRDALEFAKQDVFDVDWTVQGEVARRVGTKASDASEALSELSYRQKQKLTTALGLNVKGNSKEEDLEQALEPAVEEMIHNIERGN